MEWLHESKPISHSDSCQLSSSGARQHKLVLTAIRDSDIGQYQAKLTDKTGTTSLAFALNIVKE